jgi:hypothetical protein
MSDEINVVEKSVEKVLIDLMAKKVMSIGIQASSMRGVQASPSTTHGSRPSQVAAEKRTKHRDDLANAKLIPTILLNYIPPLADAVSHDSVPRDFDYTLVTTYLPKGICAVRTQQDNIMTLKFSDFYPGKAANRALAQRIKDTYGDVEKGMQGYKVASIQNGAVRLAF